MTIQLSMNMRVKLLNDQFGEVFSNQLLDIGNGKIPVDISTACIQFPVNFCKFTILAAKNIDVDKLNITIQTEIAGDLMTYKSVDSVTSQDDVVNYPTEFLNSLELPGLPPHNLQLKVGSVIMMLRSINQPRLCNDTRLAVKKLMNNVIEATILTGKYKGEDVSIPRIPIIPIDMPFDFKRLQFPVRLAFAMTINKSQGQALSVCGINLENPCFSHGQLYVACPRVGKPSALFVYAAENKTKNVVYHKALQ
ncbi:ATP-dependent DNA helicase Pif1-like [Colletes latitarsis]|uniref:ATP-dependent DNA helicase Pif1-like n=1 Tax=Colletes latitarsis TaxID=2605962 RepID=UPI0040361E3A